MISVIVPILNEKKNLEELIVRIINTLDKINQNFEIVLVDDGSSDNSINEFEKLKNNFKKYKIKYICHEITEGHQKALLTGIRSSAGDYICSIDGDLQDPPELISEIVNILNKNKDIYIVNTVRKKRLGEPYWKIFLIYLFYKIYNYTHKVKIIPNSGDFRICRKEVYEKLLNIHKNNFIFFRIDINKLGYKSETIFYDQQKRKNEKAKGTFIWLLNFAIDAFLISEKDKEKKYLLKFFLFQIFF